MSHCIRIGGGIMSDAKPRSRGSRGGSPCSLALLVVAACIAGCDDESKDPGEKPGETPGETGIYAAARGGTPFDATPDPDGNFVYYVAIDAEKGGGVFKVDARQGGEPELLAQGEP